MSDQFCTMYDIPAYEYWLLRQDMEPAHKFHREFLQHLQYGRPRRRFVLKAPAHLLSMEALFKMYPDALVVQTHPEPLEVLPSAASLTTVLRSVFSDDVDPAAIGGQLTKYWEDALEKLLDARKGFGSHAFFDVDLRMHTFLESNSPAKHGQHSYSWAAFGMNPVNFSERFSSYRTRFNLPDINWEHINLSK
jgi:hypothetical protein